MTAHERTVDAAENLTDERYGENTAYRRSLRLMAVRRISNAITYHHNLMMIYVYDHL